MTGIDLGQNILSAEAGANVGDVGGVQAQASVDFLGGAKLKRGINLELGVSAMAQVDAAFAKFLAADAQVRGQAKAQLKGQVQAPIDLFSEAGVAVRLQAVAQLALSARLAIGLSVGDFIALAHQDPRIRGVYLRLLEIFLEEINVQAGVQGKVAYSAMAYLNLVVTGRLVEDDANGLPAGFTIAANCGAGLKGGGGWGLFAQLGFKNSRRFVRRSVDVMVDDMVLRLQREMPTAASRQRVTMLRAPAKMALRGGFELGLALVDNASALSNAGPQLAQRCVQVVLEEAQRILLEQITILAIELIKEGLDQIGAGAAAWNASSDEREFLQEQLGDMPDDPLEPTPENIDYWLGVINGVVTLSLELGGALIPPPMLRATALLWSSLQLVFVATQRVTDASVRASFFGTFSAEQRIQAFKGQVIDQAPAPTVVRNYINQQLGRADGAELLQEHLVTFLTSEAIDEMIVRYPSTRALLEIVAGPDASPAALSAGANVVLNNSGAFVPTGAGGEMDPEASLRALSGGLQAYINTRIRLELAPEIYAAIGDQPDLRLYVDDVLLPSMDFIVGTAFDGVLDWSFGNVGYADALKEACSSIVMKVVGRSLVVTTDVLMTHASRAASAELYALAQEVDDNGGLGDELADTIGADRELVGEVLHESLEICAEVFGPMPDATRAKIRNLLYTILDSVPPNADADWVDQLQQDAFIPDARTRDALMELGTELGGALAGYMQAFYERVLTRIGAIALEELGELIDQFLDAVAMWVDDLQEALAALLGRLAALPAFIAEQLARVAAALDRALEHAFDLLTSRLQSVEALGTKLATYVYDRSLGRLLDNDQYKLMPGRVARLAREALTDAASIAANSVLLGPIADRFAEVAADAPAAMVDTLRVVLEEARELNPQVDVVGLVREHFLDEVIASVRDVFGDSDPALNLEVSFSYSTPAVGLPGTPFYVPAQTISVFMPLGSVSVPLGGIETRVREALGSLAVVEDQVNALAQALMDAFAAQDEHTALVLEQGIAQQQRALFEARVADLEGGPTDTTVLSPLPGGIYQDALDLDVHIRNASKSFLGLDDLEQPRILLLLNQEVIANERFDVQIVDGEAQTGATALDLALAMTGTTLSRRTDGPAALARTGGRAASPGVTAMRRIGDGGGDGLRNTGSNGGSRGRKAGGGYVGSGRGESTEHAEASGHLDSGSGARASDIATATSNRAIQRRRSQVNPGDDMGSRAAAAAGRAAARRGAGATREHSLFGKDKAPARFGKSPVHTIGKVPPSFTRDEDAHSLGGGLRLQLRLSRDELRDGFNTLSVIVTDGQGATDTQVVTFVAAAVETDAGRDISLTGKPQWGFEHLPDEVVRWMKLDRQLEQSLHGRGDRVAASRGGAREAADRDCSAPSADSALWIDSRSTRRRALAQARRMERDRAGDVRTRLERVTRTLAGPGLRPGVACVSDEEAAPPPDGKPQAKHRETAGSKGETKA